MNLRARLLLGFLLLALAPTLALTWVMLDQIERAHRVLVPSPGVEQALESALVVSKTTLRRTEATLHGLAADWAGFLEPAPMRPPQRASIAVTLRSAGVDLAQLYRREAGTWKLVEEVDPPGVLPAGPTDLSAEIESALAGDGTVRSPRGALGAVASVAPDWAVVAADRTPPDFFDRVAAAGEGAALYRRIAAGYGQVSRVALLLGALALFLMLALLAGWLAARLSGQLTRPVAGLAAAFERVAAGDLEARVRPAGAREVKRLGTSFNQMVERLAEARAQLARAEREAAWRGIARRVAHEIKNALTPMRLSLHGLQKRLGDVPESERAGARKGLDALLEEIESLSRLAEQFSDYARLPEPRRRLLDLTALARSAVALHERPGFELLFQSPAEPVWVDGDSLMLGRVLNNLLVNALEAMPQGGCVEVEVRVRDGHAQVEVRDRGEGIPEEIRSRVFEPYFSTKGRGSGLGLAMSRDIVAQHGGSLALEGRQDRGTTVRVALPLAQAGPGAARGETQA